MIVRVKREEFLGRLQSVQPGLSTNREVVEQSSCLIFKLGAIITFNDEVSCRCPWEKHKGFEGAVAAKPLMLLLAQMPEDEIELEMSGNELLVKGIRRKAGIRMESEIALPVNLVERPETWHKLPEHFNEALEITHACAGTDDSRFQFTCVHFHPRYLEACDNVQMARYKIKTGLAGECIIRKDALAQVVTLGMTEIAETESWVHFKNASGTELACRRYSDVADYPDLSAVMEVEGDPITLPGGLAEEVKRAEIFSKDNTDDKVMVQLKSGKIKIKGFGTSGWFESRKAIKYDGEPIEFLISPKLLIELTKKTNECFVAPERLKVKGERYTYISFLFKTEPLTTKPEPAEATEE